MPRINLVELFVFDHDMRFACHASHASALHTEAHPDESAKSSTAISDSIALCGGRNRKATARKIEPKPFRYFFYRMERGEQTETRRRTRQRTLPHTLPRELF